MFKKDKFKETILAYLKYNNIFVVRTGFFKQKKCLVLNNPNFFYKDILNVNEILGMNICEIFKINLILNSRILIELDKFYRIKKVSEREDYDFETLALSDSLILFEFKDLPYLDDYVFYTKNYIYSSEGLLINISDEKQNINIELDTESYRKVIINEKHLNGKEHAITAYKEINSLNKILLDNTDMSLRFTISQVLYKPDTYNARRGYSH